MKSRRHFAIRDIISTERISTQEELCEVLRARGFDITQATVSRDIKELSLIKIPYEDGYAYAWPDAPNTKNAHLRIKRAFQDSVVSYDYSENIIVIKTLPGAAQSVASLIDSLANSHIIGTVAGDDTIFLIVKPKKSLPQVMDYFHKLATE
ncbi:MAG: arginine repressor [Syntrophomonas sp.]|nr:arginine repressor [Syntrophomonas sp.]